MRHRAWVLAPVVVAFTACTAFADARLSVLVDVLKLREAAAILSKEGIAQSQDLNADMLDGQGGPGWALQVERIYAPDLMVEMVRSELGKELQGPPLEEVIAFFASDLGTEIIDLENAARQAIQDPDVEEAARARFAELAEQDDERLALVSDLIASGDMISRNVTSAMNSNYQFFRGMVDGKAIEMSEEDILADVSGDIEESTEDTTAWLSGYMLLAYHPLTEAELRDYLRFSETDAGKALNRALFAGFGKAYEDISYGLGRAVALNMTAQDL